MSAINNSFNNYYTTNNNYFGALPNGSGLTNNPTNYSVLVPNQLNPGMAAGAAGDLRALLGNHFSTQVITNNNFMPSNPGGFGVSPYNNINVTQNYGVNPGFGIPNNYGLNPAMMQGYGMPPSMMPPMAGYGQSGYGVDSLYNRMMDLMSGIVDRITDLISSRNRQSSVVAKQFDTPEFFRDRVVQLTPAPAPRVSLHDVDPSSFENDIRLAANETHTPNSVTFNAGLIVEPLLAAGRHSTPDSVTFNAGLIVEPLLAAGRHSTPDSVTFNAGLIVEPLLAADRTPRRSVMFNPF